MTDTHTHAHSSKRKKHIKVFMHARLDVSLQSVALRVYFHLFPLFHFHFLFFYILGIFIVHLTYRIMCLAFDITLYSAYHILCSNATHAHMQYELSLLGFL